MTLPRLALLLPLAVLLAGCGSGQKPCFPVTGKVLDANKKPALGALVVLHPVGGDEKDPRASGTVEADGTVKFTTYTAGDGAPAGDYEVTVVWIPARKTAFDAEGKDQLGGRYATPKRSPIPKFTVKADGPNELPPITLK